MNKCLAVRECVSLLPARKFSAQSGFSLSMCVVVKLFNFWKNLKTLSNKKLPHFFLIRVVF